METEVPVGVCAEASRSNVDLIRKTASTLGYLGETAHGSFHLVHGVVADNETLQTNSSVEFPNSFPGWEGARLYPAWWWGPTKFPIAFKPTFVKTVDGIVAELGLNHVDI